MNAPGEQSAPRPKAEDDEQAARQEVNPDLHGQAREVEEKQARGDPEADPG